MTTAPVISTGGSLRPEWRDLLDTALNTRFLHFGRNDSGFHSLCSAKNKLHLSSRLEGACDRNGEISHQAAQIQARITTAQPAHARWKCDDKKIDRSSAARRPPIVNLHLYCTPGTVLYCRRQYNLLILWWSRPESNRRPSHCERDALPTELRPHCRRGRANSRPDRTRMIAGFSRLPTPVRFFCTLNGPPHGARRQCAAEAHLPLRSAAK